MVGVAQLVELRVVIPAVVGSNPIVHPNCHSNDHATFILWPMQISVETMTGLERRLKIVVPSEVFEQQITDKLTEARGRIRLDGFRPGKVPMKEVRRRFGNGVRAEVAGDLMQSSFLQAIEEEQLAPAGSPNLEVIKMDPGIDFEFSATFEVLPTVALQDLSALRVKKPHAEITEADVDTMVAQLREQRRSFESVDRGAEDGDRVTVDFVGRIDGEIFEGGQGEAMPFVLGEGRMIPDFEAGIRGASAGETVTFDAGFPSDYPAEQLRDSTAAFEVHLTAVETSVLPELDAAFFEAFGITEDQGEQGFRDEVRSNMVRELDNAVRNQVKAQVLRELADAHEVALPETMVHSEIQALKRQMQQQMQSFNAGRQMPEMADDLFRADAEKRVKTGLIVGEIVRDKSLTPDGALVRAHIEEMASTYAEPTQVVNYYYSNEELLTQVEQIVLEQQVIDSIIAEVDLEMVESNYNDVIAGKAIASELNETVAPLDGAESGEGVAPNPDADSPGDGASPADTAETDK